MKSLALSIIIILLSALPVIAQDYTNTTEVNMIFSMSDDLSGMSSMQCSMDAGVSWEDTEVYTSETVLQLLPVEGQHIIKCRFSDMAGNWSEDKTQIVILDMVGPHGTIKCRCKKGKP
jgi:hypothetical protein